MKNLVVIMIALVIFCTSCSVQNNPIPGIDELISCEKCTVSVTRFVDNDDHTQWKGNFYTCSIDGGSCKCELTGDSGWGPGDGGDFEVAQPYPLPNFMSSCKIK